MTFVSGYYFCYWKILFSNNLFDLQSTKMLLRDFSNYSEAKFLNELSQLDLTGAVSGLNDVNKSFSVFYNKLNKLLNRHAPFKPISKRKKEIIKTLGNKGDQEIVGRK